VRRGLNVLLQAGLLVGAIVVLGSYGLVAWAHATDRWQIDRASGVWAGLAMYLNEGTFYPELYDGARFGGTRYMPLHFVLHAGLARLTGEYLFSGKLLAYSMTLILFALLFHILRGLQSSVPVALALLSLVVLNLPGLLACTTIRGDLLPAVLQLAALLVAGGVLNWRRAVPAALLCTLAVLSKTTAVWGILAITWFYFTRQRRLALVFGLTWVVSSAGSFWLLDWLSAGRMQANLRSLSTPELFNVSALLAPLLFLYRVANAGVLLALLAPLMVIECWQACRQRRTTIYHLGLTCAVLVTMPLFADKGVWVNHLLDAVILAIPVLGCLWAHVPAAAEPRLGLRPALGVLLVWMTCSAWSTELAMPCLEVVRTLRDGTASSRYPARPLAQLIGDNEPILSQDQWVSISRRHLPVVLDVYSMARFNSLRPELADPLKQRIRNQEFRWLVLCYEIGDPMYFNRNRWEEMDFGPETVQVMNQYYQLHTRLKDWAVYVPRPVTTQSGE